VGRRPGPALAVVGDVQEHLPVRAVDRDCGPRRAGVARDVRERLLDDAKGGSLDVGRERIGRRAPEHAHLDARGPHRVEQRVEVRQPRRRARGLVATLLAHAAHGRARLGQRVARHVRDPFERRPGLGGVGVDRRAPSAGLHGDGAQLVADDVVHVARDAHALARGGLPRLGGAQLREAARLVADLAQ
jgi:hypothetical protein